jgi:hypothetical protein
LVHSSLGYALGIDFHYALRIASGMENILRIWPTMADLAADLGIPYQTVAAWKNRGRIPATYDVQIVDAAKARGVPLTFEALAVARAGIAQIAQTDTGAAA